MFLKAADVIVDSRTYLKNFGIGKKAAQTTVHSHFVYPEQKSLFRARELQQCYTISGLIRRKCRPRLRIKADYLL